MSTRTAQSSQEVNGAVSARARAYGSTNSSEARSHRARPDRRSLEIHFHNWHEDIIRFRVRLENRACHHCRTRSNSMCYALRKSYGK